VADVGEGRGCSGVTMANRDGRRRSEDVVSVRVAGGQEGDGLNSFYVVMWCWRSTWPGLGDDGSTGRRRGRAVAEVRAHRRSGSVVLVLKSEIG
jgi:hypothetical protein